jgi:hypothetical protein
MGCRLVAVVIMFIGIIISEKYKTAQSFKLLFLPSIPNVRLYSSGSDCKSVGSILGNHFVQGFSALPSHS